MGDISNFPDYFKEKGKVFKEKYLFALIMPDIKLDLKDRKLLFALDFHARDPNSLIAKKIGLSKQGTDYRIASLQKKGVITGFYPVIDVGALGYYYCRFFFKLQNLTQEKEKEICYDLIEDKRIHWIIKFEGAYDLGMAAYMKSLSDFKHLSEEILEKYGTYIKEKKESIGIKITHFQNRYLLNTKETKEIGVEEIRKEAELEEIDKELLKLISENGRTSLVDLGEKLNVSPKVVSYHLKKLEKNKIILGYRPNIDHNKIGYTHYKILFYLMNVTQEELLKFKFYLKMLPEVFYIVEEVGIADVDIELMLPKEANLFDFINKIRFDFPQLIREYEIIICAKTLEIEYVPF